MQAAAAIEAELRLRGLEIPFEAVRNDIAELEHLVNATLSETMPALEEKPYDFLADYMQPN
jgi:hypothetical protein